MAVEKLIMMNVIGKKDYVDEVIKDILLFENVQIVDAYNEIENFRFSIDVTEHNMVELLGFSEAESGLKIARRERFEAKIKLLNEVFGDEHEVDPDIIKNDIDLPNVIKSVNDIYNQVHEKYAILKILQNDIDEIDKSIKAYEFLSSANIEMEKLNNLKNFNYIVGTLTKENVQRLKNNYGNITAIVVHVGSMEDNEVYLVTFPWDLERETTRILKSLNFNKLEGFKDVYKDTPLNIVKWLKSKKEKFVAKVDALESEVNTLKTKYKDQSNYAYNVLHLYDTINTVKNNMAFSTEHFFFSGWISKRLKKQITEALSQYQGIVIMFNDDHKDPSIKPPTKLRNNWLFKPFESLIKMYGIPNYNEVDPTPFFSITYLFLYGFMFGDLGQGFVFFLAGFLLKWKGVGLGSILSRLGISSMFFGLMYGSVFGFETIIPALWLKPFENINTLLLIAIGIGVVTIAVAYIYGIINQYKAKDYYNSLLSKNGLTGFVLYFCLILVALALFTGNRMISIGVLAGIIVIAIAILFMKEPIVDKLSHKRKDQSHKLDSNFFVESFFDVFEILLSILSNTLSFIRVGAFALNHVGLFLAFESLAHMVNSGVGSTLIYILGNIFIIILEGVIVAIQVLRLEYYELFSKYFIGGGEEFKATKL
ncbi:V-type ATP synthase subunit I [Alkalibaculum bacchi]|uniref:V-type ATP synthase subunit I n=1 Tax=Alkalibaculum bacchi TaxID=645887 RepID=UPI0026EBB905|nr:V-type ATPase 116kDa subunit family protein [Alkalibaculum bacchi]